MNMRFGPTRVAKDLTQQELADRIQATRQTIGLIEKGKYNPSIDLSIRIARALNELLWEEKEDE